MDPVKLSQESKEQCVLYALVHLPKYVPYIKMIGDNYFTMPENKVIFAAIRAYFEEHQSSPTALSLVDYLMSGIGADQEKLVDVFKNIMSKPNPRDYAYYIKNWDDNLKDLHYQQLYTEDSVNALEARDYGKIKEIVMGAEKLDRIGSSNVDLWEDTPPIELLPAPFQSLGQIDRGSASLFIGKTGQGKTTMLLNVAANYVKLGFNVFYVGFEEDKSHLQRKFLSTLFYDHVKKNNMDWMTMNIASMREMYDPKWGKMDIWKYTYGEAENEPSPDFIKGTIDINETNNQVKYDILILDYLDHLSDNELETSKKNPNKIDELVVIKLTEMVKKKGMAVFSAAQTNRSSFAKDATAGLDNIRGSLSRVYPMSYTFLIDANMETGNTTVIKDKSRIGKRGLKAYLKYDGYFHYSERSMDEIYQEEIGAENDELAEQLTELKNSIEESGSMKYVAAGNMPNKLKDKLFHAKIIDSKNSEVAKIDGRSARIYKIDMKIFNDKLNELRK